MSFLFHLTGFVFVIAGIAWIATLLGAAQLYVVPAAAVLLCASIVVAAMRARSEPSPFA